MGGYKHNCIICGNEYLACNNCVRINDFSEINKTHIDRYCEENGIVEPEKSKMFVGYRSVCDTIEHYMVYGVIRLIKRGDLAKADVLNQLIEFGITLEDIYTFKDSVKEFLLANIEVPMSTPVFEAVEDTISDAEETEEVPFASFRRRGKK